jgi:outer membrane protein assembly factor BamB
VVPKNTYVSSPLVADASGNIYYNVVQLSDPSLGDPWVSNDVVGSWLVKVTQADAASTVTYSVLVPNAPPASSQNCPGTFSLLHDQGASLPWPPSANAVPPTLPCGSQRPGINLAPAIAPDGTIYTGSRAHFDHRVGYVVAVNSDLTLKWASSLQDILSDGCGVLVPIGPTNNSPNACRVGTTPGVDPTTNAKGSGLIEDQGSSSPTVLPDGSILFPALSSYNGSRGHLFKFDATGNFLGAFDFGWDSTPAVYAHNHTYSIVVKDNHYFTTLYCPYRGNPLCPPVADVYYITQLSPSLQVEWKFQSTNTQSCSRNADGSMHCVSDHPSGFEWCINAPAIDMNGTVYANSEDGNLYTIPQGNTGVFTKPSQSIFLNLAIGAAYTPLSLGPDGKIYTENDGHMFVVGN